MYGAGVAGAAGGVVICDVDALNFTYLFIFKVGVNVKTHRLGSKI